VTLHAERDGSGPRLVLVHGFTQTRRSWGDLAVDLARDHEVVRVDAPGHGRSAQVAVGVEDGARLLGDAGGRATYVGYSMGGRLALYLALHHPERCRGLFLESASPGLEDAAERAARRDADEVRAARLESGDLEGFIQGWYRQPLFASLGSREELLRRIIEARRGNDPKELARSLRQMGTGNGPSLWGELPGLRAPALAVAGVLDEKYVGVACRMVEFNPQIRAAVIPGAGHNVRVEAPGAYIGLLKEILQSL
jgi:2-succinyl-6-hydroxy-2,4-cyclohexadiene-1-carboxylate synthase